MRSPSDLAGGRYYRLRRLGFNTRRWIRGTFARRRGDPFSALLPVAVSLKSATTRARPENLKNVLQKIYILTITITYMHA